MSTKNPHDKLFRKIFSDPGAAVEMIKATLPGHIFEQLDLKSLKLEKDTFVDDDLKEHLSDLIFSCRWKTGEKTLISFVLEHKSFVPAFPHFQLLKYHVCCYQQQLANDKNRKYFTPVIPIVLYHGQQKWKYRPFDQYFQVPDDPIKKFIPKIEYILWDLSEWPDEKIKKLKSGIAVTTLLLMKHQRDTEYLLRNTREIFIFVSGISKEDAHAHPNVKAIIKYTFDTFVFQKKQIQLMIEQMPSEIREEALTGSRLLINQGLKEGLEKGEQRGFKKGEQKGFKKGEQEGFKKGESKGWEKGNLFRSVKVAMSSFKDFPEMTIEQIVKLSGLDGKLVKKLKTEVFQQETKERAAAVLQEIFRKCGGLGEPELEELLTLRKTD